MTGKELLTQVNRKLERLLSILDQEGGEDEAVYQFCIRQADKGNWKPLNAYLRRSAAHRGEAAASKAQRGAASGNG